MSRTELSSFLRRVLVMDAITSGAAGLLMVAAAGTLDPLLGVPAALLRYAGLSLFPFAAFVAWLATRDTLPRRGIWTVVALNAAWVLASVLLVIDGPIAPNGLGITFILVQALAVAVLAELQIVGLRKGAAPRRVAVGV